MDTIDNKRYLTITGAVFVTALVLMLIILGALALSGRSNVPLTLPRVLLISLGSAIVPAGSFTGFVSVFSRVDILSHRGSIAIVLLCAPLVLAANVWGIIILVPYFARAMYRMLKNRA